MPSSRPLLPEAVVSDLRCPHCHSSFSRSPGALRCARGHCFDLAREGYVNLLAGRRPASTGDTPAMVEARCGFLARGHFQALAHAITAQARALAGDASEACVVECGAGPGYYLAQVIDALPGARGIGVDVSRPAVRRLARAHPRIGAVIADVEDAVPLHPARATLALSIFAPRNAAELARITTPGGAVLVATAGPRHLTELIQPLGLLRVDPLKHDRLRTRFSPGFVTADERTVEYALHLSHDDVELLVGMGPSAFHLSPEELRRRISTLREPVNVTASFAVWSLRRVLG